MIRNYYNITQSPLCRRLLWDVIPDSAHCCSPDWLAGKKKMGETSLPGNSSCNSMKIHSSRGIFQDRARYIAMILLTNSKHCTKIKSSLKGLQEICPSEVIPETEMLLTHQQAGNTIKERKVRAARTNCGCRVCILMLLMDDSALQLLSCHSGSLSEQGSRGLRHKRNNRLCALLFFCLL